MTDTAEERAATALSGRSLYSWFADIARQHPYRVALEVAGTTLTYAELADLAERLAATIDVATGGRNRPRVVGLLTGRSVAAYAGYLATLQLSAAVVPLGVDAPVERNRGICAAAGVDVLIVDDTVDATSVAGSAPVLVLANTADRAWWSPLSNLPVEPHVVNPDGIAYVIFTSGSTGVPKGVPIRHRNATEYIAKMIKRYRLGPGARMSQAFALTFDGSVFDLFAAWCSGATLVVPQPDELMTPVRFINDRQLTHWFSVPSVAALASRLGMLRTGCMPGLRWSLFGGEPLTLELAAAWADAAPASVVENLYGPTEVTVSCTAYRLPADRQQWPATSTGTVPIGRVYDHLEGLVLDEQGTIADVGELYVRGCQRFDGYLDRECDSGRFLGDGPDKWYRTGDRVRLEDGELVYLGRIDDQIKIRGYRIELGEVECVLRQYEHVSEVVVLAVSVGRAELELCAVYVGRKVDKEQLQAFAATRLPGYMTPLRYVELDRLPLNSNGKVDRRRLATDLADRTRSATA